MELSEKIQKLRKDNNYTQEQLAEKLCVSRTAVSKWETGRGMPSMDSLQQLAKLFNVTFDELLSTSQIAVIAESENKENINRFIKYFCAIINISAFIGLLLPLYKAIGEGTYYSVPIYQLNPLKGVIFSIAPVVMVICGILQLLFDKLDNKKLNVVLNVLCTSAHIVAVLIFVLCGHPYPALLFFFLLAIKNAFLIKKYK